MNLLKYFLSLTLILGPYAQAWDQATSKVVQVDQASGVSSTPNYWKSGDAELTLTGVAAYADAVSAKPVDCTGGSPAITVARSATAPMYDKQSWLITKPASNVQGQGVAFEFDVDNGIAAVEMMDLMFEYIVGSGTFAAGSDTTNSDLMVYLYDVTAGKLIEPYGGSKLYTSSTTLKGDYRGWFQSTLGSKKYRVCLHQATTSASAYTLKVDAGKVQKSKQVVGTIITDWQSYTPDVFEGNTNRNSEFSKREGSWRRIGDSIEVMLNLVRNASTSVGSGGNFFATLPNGLVGIDVSANEKVGFWKKPGDNTEYAIQQVVGSNRAFWFVGNFNTSAYLYNNTNFAPNTTFVVGASVPIKGWSAGARMSDGYDGVQIAANLSGSTTSVANTTINKLSFTNILNDDTGIWDSVNSAVKIKASGTYVIRGSASFSGIPNNTTAAIRVYFYKNNALYYASGPTTKVTNTGPGSFGDWIAASAETQIKVIAGDIIDFRVYQDTGSSRIPALAYFSIEKLSGTPFMSPTALWETHYAGTAGDAIGTSDSLIKFTTKVEDTFGSYNPATGLWTAKGPASCSAAGRVSSTVNLPTNQGYTGSIHKNGVRYVLCTRSNGTGVNANHSTVCANTSIKVNTGDTISINAVSDVATTAATAVESSYFTVSCRQSGN